MYKSNKLTKIRLIFMLRSACHLSEVTENIEKTWKLRMKMEIRGQKNRVHLCVAFPRIRVTKFTLTTVLLQSQNTFTNTIHV